MSDVQFREIGGRKFTTAKLPASKAWALRLRMGKVLGPALPKLAEMTKEMAPEQRNDGAMKMLGELVEIIDPDQLLSLMIDLCKNAWCNGTKIEDVDVVFADADLDMFKVAVFVGEVNLKDFFNVSNQPDTIAKMNITMPG